jgi:Fe-Mn family superoxide dismutase
VLERAAQLAPVIGECLFLPLDFKALGGGSGWVLLTYSPHDKRLVNTWGADHTMTLANGRPILALDMYEHAYHMDYGAKAASYIDAFMQNIKWSNAATLYDRYSRES